MKSIESMIGPRIFASLIVDLRAGGIDLESASASYSPSELKIVLDQLFGEASMLFLDEIKKALPNSD